MDLFVVNRYQSHEPVESANENDHLSALLKRIEERKKEKLAASIESTKEKDDNRVEKISTKKRKKRKLLHQEQTKQDSIDNVEKEEFSSTPPVSEQIDYSRDDNNFTILGSASKKKLKAVKRVLPRWLAHPEIISADLNSGPSLDEFQDDLDPKLIEVLKSNSLVKFFPVQANIIRWLLKCNKDRIKGFWPRDTCVSAPTGSGKTLAYVLPIIQDLQSYFVPKIRCLVVLPVQELAAQVFKVFCTYSNHTKLRICLISGASSFEVEQNNLVKKSHTGEISVKVDVVVATPGRLIDHIEKTEGFCIDCLKYLVIDEADRSTDWLQYIPAPHSKSPSLTFRNVRKSIHPPAQKLLFSATLSQDPEKLSRLGLFMPILFTSVVISGRDDDVDLDREVENFAGRYTSPGELIERAVKCESSYKPIMVYELLLANKDTEKTLVFTNSGEAAHRLAILLRSLMAKHGIGVDELSAQLTPKRRGIVLEAFVNGSVKVLVSSDALARGLDIPNVKLVISYDLPKHIEGYIHRSGRTARAGTSGTAVSILTPVQTSAFAKILSFASKNVPTIEEYDSLDKIAQKVDYEDHLEKLKETLASEQSAILEKSKKRKFGKRKLENKL